MKVHNKTYNSVIQVHQSHSSQVHNIRACISR